MNMTAAPQAVLEADRETAGGGLLPAARFCPHEHTCTETGSCGAHALCEVSEDIGLNVVALAAKQPLACPYRLSISCGEYCTCPRHYALFLKSGQ